MGVVGAHVSNGPHFKIHNCEVLDIPVKLYSRHRTVAYYTISVELTLNLLISLYKYQVYERVEILT
jgi:hypothetical protein